MCLVGIAGQSLAQPANDNFVDAQVISGATGIVVGSTLDATREPSEPAHWQATASGASIWYRWTAPADGQVTFDTIGSSYDTVLAVYTGAAVDALTLVVANDDSAGLQSRVVFTVVGGTEYQIAVDGYDYGDGSRTGRVVLRWRPGDGTPVPAGIAGAFQFSSTAYVVTENETIQAGLQNPVNLPTINDRSPKGAVITVVRTGGSAGRVSIPYKTLDTVTNACGDTNSFDAVPNCDYTPTSGTLVFDEFQMSRSFVIPVRSDFRLSGDKSLLVVLEEPQYDPLEEANKPGLIRPVLGDIQLATVTVVEINQGRRIVTQGTNIFLQGTNFVIERATYALDEADGSITVDILNIGGAAGNVDVVVSGSANENRYVPLTGSDYADPADTFFGDPPYTDGSTNILNPADFTEVTANIAFNAGQFRRSLTINIANDSAVEFNEDILVFLRRVNNQPPLGANNRARVTILYDEPPAGALDREWNPDGVSYTTPRFNPTPGANSQVRAVAVQPDQRSVIGGDFTAYNAEPVGYIARINPDGSYDASFIPGSGADGFVSAVAIYPVIGSPNDRKIVVGGGFTSFNNLARNCVARLNANGSLDNTFTVGTGARKADPTEQVTIWSVAIQSDGKVLVAGDFTEFNGVPRNGVARLNVNGSLDTSFDPGSGADGTVWSVAVRDSQQNIFVPRVAEGNEFEDVNEIETGANQGNITIDYDFINIVDNIRIYYDGALIFDRTTNGFGQFVVPFGPGTSTKVTIILNEGTGEPGTLWRYLANIVVPVLERKIFIGGEFLYFNGEYRGHVARLNDNGSLDLAYDPAGGSDGPVYSVAPQADGRLLIGGFFSTVDFRPRGNVARLENNGGLDLSYDPGSGANDAVYSIKLQPDGKAMVGGLFTSFNGTRRLGLTRLFFNGTVDTSFLDTAYNQFAGLINQFHFEQPNYVNSIGIQTNGAVMIGGSFTQLGGNWAAIINSTRPRPVLAGQFYNVWTRADKRVRHNVARLVGGYTPGPGNVEFVLNRNNVVENAGTLTVPLRRLDGRLGTVGATASTIDNLAVGGSDLTNDFTSVAGTPFWTEDVFLNEPISVGYVGESFFSITIRNDQEIEGDELFGLSLVDPFGSINLGGEVIPLGAALGRSSSTANIVEDDVNHGTLLFNAETYFTNENANLRVTVIRTNGSSGQVTVRYFTSNGTAISGQDYAGVNSGTLTFGPNITSQTFTITNLNDNFVEADETFTITLTNVANGAVLPGGASSYSVTATIIDNDLTSGHPGFASVSYATNEGAGLARVTLLRLGGSQGQLSVNVAATGGTAMEGVDFTPVTNVITWVNFDVSPKTFFVPLLDDAVVEGDKTVNLRLFNPSPINANGGVNDATLTIVEDDAYGALSFSQAIFDADERGTNVSITVVRTGGIGGTVTVDYVITDGTAQNNRDFIASGGTLTFGPGVTAASFSITILDNLLTDSNRTATLTLNNFGSATSGPIPVATLRIFDDESIGDPAGSLDTTFNALAGGTNAIHSLALQSDGKILVGGEFRTMNRVTRNRIARLNEDGSLDGSFNALGGPNAPVRAVAVQPDNRVLIGGFFDMVHGTNRNHIARLLADGTLDRFFNPGAGADNPVYAIALRHDGRIIIGGSFTTVNGIPRSGIAVLDASGSVNASFNPGPGANGTVFALAVQNDGKILMGGDFTTVGGVNRPGIARLNLDGSLDLTFNVDTGPDAAVRAIALQPDGRILVGGSFTNVNGTVRNHLARLNSSGTLDTVFLGAVEGGNGDVSGITLQFDGRIVVVGDFTRFNGVSRNRITRLNGNGKTDPTINFGEGADDSINTVVIQPDRKIVIGGRFTLFDTEARQFLARLHGGSIAGPGSLQFSSPAYDVLENAGQATITVRRRGGTSTDVTVDYYTAPGSATPGSDYTSVSNTLTFLEGEVRETFTVPIVNDFVGETNETVFLFLANQTAGVTLGAVPEAVLTIINDDSGVGFNLANYTVNENVAGGEVPITVIRTGATNGTAMVNFTTTNGTALAGQDYTAVSGLLTFAPGETVQTFRVPITDDGSIEPSETFGVLLSNLTGSSALSLAAATVTIVDNDFRPGELTFAAPTYSVSESAGSVAITVLRTNGTTGVVAVNYATVAGTALAGNDYEGKFGTLTFPEGVSSQTITIIILDDAAVEGDETFGVGLFNPGGGAVIAGSTNVIVAILDEEFGPGSVDRTFTPGTGANGLVRSVAVQTDGRIILGGAFTAFDGLSRNYVARILSDGPIDPAFDPGLGANAFVSSVASAAGSRVLLAGAFDLVDGASFNRVSLLSSNGLPDFLFNRDVGLNAAVNVMATQADGKVLLGGAFSLPTRGITRLQINGAVDNSFSPGLGADGPVHAITLQPGGNVLFGGAFATVDGEPRSRVARLSPEGLLDTSFGTGAITNGTIFCVAVQNDGKVIVGGDFSTVSGTNRVKIARLETDGSLDPSFNVGQGANATVYAAGIQSDGKIILGGDFTSINGVSRNRFVRLNTDGTVDGSFDPGRGANNTVLSLVVLPDNNIIIGGDFSEVGGVARNGVARILSGTVAPSPAFAVASLVGGQLQLSISVMPGETFVLDASLDLVTWTPRATNVATSASWQFTDPDGIGHPAYFYRVRKVTP